MFKYQKGQKLKFFNNDAWAKIWDETKDNTIIQTVVEVISCKEICGINRYTVYSEEKDWYYNNIPENHFRE